MLFDDFLINYALWLWVPHRASLVRDDGGGFVSNSRLNSRVLVRWQRSNAVHPSSLRAQRSNPWHIRKEDGLLRCARNDGCGDGRTIRTTVIPGCALGRRPGIHNHGRGLWIPGSMLRIAPECRLGVVLRFAMTVTPHSRGEAIGSINRHCERSEAIHGTSATKMD